MSMTTKVYTRMASLYAPHCLRRADILRSALPIKFY